MSEFPRCDICHKPDGIMQHSVEELHVAQGPGKRTVWVRQVCGLCAEKILSAVWNIAKEKP